MVHYNITVYGRVQGVGFRYATLQAANAFGIRGFVRNQPDGSVYIEAEGKEAAIEGFLQWCEKGPGWGRVERLVKVTSGLRGFTEFKIRH